MAQFTGTSSSYTMVDGINEDLAQIIYDVSPEDTPFVSNVGRGTCTNTLVEWLTDQLAAASSTNFKIEGDDLTSYRTATGRVRLANMTAISTKDVLVTDTQRAVDNAGISDELAYQIAKVGRELRLDVEKIVVGPQPAVAGSDTVARKTAGFEAFMNSTIGASVNRVGTDPTFSGTTKGYPNAEPVAGAARAFTEVILKDVAQKVWTKGGNLNNGFMLVGPVNKGKASAFTGIAQLRKEAPGTSPATIMGAADVYVGDFGNITFVPSRLSRENSALFVDPNYAEVCYLQPFHLLEMARTGLAEKRVIEVEYMLRINALGAHGIAADLLIT